MFYIALQQTKKTTRNMYIFYSGWYVILCLIQYMNDFF